jgi:hypothetical protein
LKAVTQIVEKMRNFHMTDRMLLIRERFCQHACALASPAQWRFGIPACQRFNQGFQRTQSCRITGQKTLASSSVPTDASGG